MPQDDSKKDPPDKANRKAGVSDNQQQSVSNEAWVDPLQELMNIESDVQSKRNTEANDSLCDSPLETEPDVLNSDSEGPGSVVILDNPTNSAFTSLLLEHRFIVILFAGISLIIAIVMIRSATESPEIIVEQSEQEQLAAWLAQAEQHLQAGQLTEPAQDNALVLFQQVLERQPEQAQALAGIESIKTQLLQLAEEAQTQQQWDSARSHLEAVLTIDPADARALTTLEIIENKIAVSEESIDEAEIEDILKFEQSTETEKPEQSIVDENELLEILSN